MGLFSVIDFLHNHTDRCWSAREITEETKGEISRRSAIIGLQKLRKSFSEDFAVYLSNDERIKSYRFFKGERVYPCPCCQKKKCPEDWY